MSFEPPKKVLKRSSALEPPKRVFKRSSALATNDIQCTAYLFLKEDVPLSFIEEVAACIGAVRHLSESVESNAMTLDDFIGGKRPETGLPRGFNKVHTFVLAPQSGTPSDGLLTRLEGRIGEALLASETLSPVVSLIPAPHGLHGSYGVSLKMLKVGLTHPRTFDGSSELFESYKVWRV